METDFSAKESRRLKIPAGCYDLHLGSLLLWKEWCLKCPLDESLLVVDLLMDHLSKVWKNLVFSLGSFLIIEHCQCSSKSKTNKQINIQNRTGLEDLATTCNFVNVNDCHLILMYMFWPHFGLNKRSPEFNLSQRGYKASIEMK